MPPPLVIRNGTLVADGLERADLLCVDGSIARVGPEPEPAGATVIDAAGLVVGPGFVDVHVHGGGGHSFFSSDPAKVTHYARWAPRNGVTAFLVSTVGPDPGQTAAILSGLTPAVRPESGAAEPLGFHLEGPFLSSERRGAFPRSYLRAPSIPEFARYQEAAKGLIRQVTIAPELDGASDLIRAVSSSSTVASVGHTDGTFAQVCGAFAAGARHVTHLFNAMRPLHQREGGPVAACLLENEATCELICDGAHVAPEMLRLAYGLLGPGRAAVVTDNLEMAGVAGCGGNFGGERLSVKGATAVRPDGTIAGSLATMDTHFRNAVRILDLDLPTAFRLCAANPARIAGAANRKGRIEAGLDADLVLLDSNLEVAATVCRGEVAFARPALVIRSRR